MKNNNLIVPRSEYPRPQLVREHWINLNGQWDFEFDFGNSGKARKLYLNGKFTKKILVPFCPESKLSGIEYKDFMTSVWYKKEFEIPTNLNNKRIILHFGAVDYESEVWINGHSVGVHKGGYSSFEFEITKYLVKGINIIVVLAEDDNRTGLQPRGKQSSEFYSHGCDYTRTTGIWQTVWLEAVPKNYILILKLTPDINNGKIIIEGKIDSEVLESHIVATASFNGAEMGSTDVSASGDCFFAEITLEEIHQWSPNSPNLYDLKVVLKSKDVEDEVTSYFGLRSINLRNGAILLNEKPVYQRLVLDQGFYPDGIYTAPTDKDLIKDIEISMALGFNGARLHQKVFEPRFLYHADKIGYLVWGEQGSWGLNITNSVGLQRFLPEWIEVLERDYNHPSIIGWCPFNETWDDNGTKQNNEVLSIVYKITKAIDKTRPVIDTSGNFHVITDIFDIHDYEQNPERFAEKFEQMKNGGEVFNTYKDRQNYEGQPYFVSEYGGIWWKPGQKDDESWGYGQRPRSVIEFIQRYKGLTDTLLQNPKICASCYTQLYDVEQETNGLYTYDRKPKFDPEVFKAINTQKAAIEE